MKTEYVLQWYRNDLWLYRHRGGDWEFLEMGLYPGIFATRIEGQWVFHSKSLSLHHIIARCSGVLDLMNILGDEQFVRGVAKLNAEGKTPMTEYRLKRIVKSIAMLI